MAQARKTGGARGTPGKKAPARQPRPRKAPRAAAPKDSTKASRPMTTDVHYAEARAAILAAALPDIPFDGWTGRSLRQAAGKAGIEQGLARLAFPGGTVDLVRYFIADGDRRMEAELARHDLAAMKVRERITFAVRTRLEVDEDNREALRRATAYLALPTSGAAGVRALYGTVDAIWRACGDTSTDYNFYTKRLILSGVFSSTAAVWFGDDSEGFEKTWAFLDRRIADVMQIEKVKGTAEKVLSRVPSPLGLVSRLRYPLGR